MSTQVIFANNSGTTVPSGGTTAPAAGTQESWTVASSASFPAASSSAVPATSFHVADQALPAEKIQVVNVSGTTWTVVRGAEGTTPVAHTAGFTVNQVITAGDYGQFAQSFPQQPGLTPAFPAAMEPVQWAMASFDTGPEEVPATYANNTITYNTGATANGGSSTTAAITLTVPSGALTGDLLILAIEINNASSQTPKVVAASGHTWTQLGSTLTQTTSGWTNSAAVFTRTAAAGDAGDTLTLSAVSGASVYIAGGVVAYSNASGVDVSATSTPAGFQTSANAPSVTSSATGDVFVYIAAPAIGSGASQAVTGSAADPYVYPRISTADNGNVVVIADSAQWWPSGTTRGGGSDITFSGGSNVQYCLWTLALTPAGGYSGSSAPTLTANSNGALTIDGGSPLAGDRVVVSEPYENNIPANQGDPSGIYTVTSAGSAGSPWVLTRAPDMASSATLGQFWAVQVKYGTTYAGGSVRVEALVPGPPANYLVTGPNVEPGTLPVYGLPWVMGSSGFGLAAQSVYSSAYGPATTAVGAFAAALGTQSTVDGAQGVALGNSATGHAAGLALGAYSNIPSGTGGAVTIGRYAYASANGAVAAGSYASAYTPDMTALASGQIATQGDSQRSVIVFAGQTANATQTAITPTDGPFAFNDKNGSATWKKTAYLSFTAVARRTDSAGNDAVFTATGTLAGNGTSAYSWVGGVAPTFTKSVSNGTTTGWAVAASVSSNNLVIQVTGASASTINWAVITDLYEISG